MKLSEALRISMDRFNPLGGRFFQESKNEEKPRACVWGGIVRVLDPSVNATTDPAAKRTVDVLMTADTGYGDSSKSDMAHETSLGFADGVFDRMDQERNGRPLADMRVKDFPCLNGFSLYSRYRFFNDYMMRREYHIDPRPIILADMEERGL